MKKTTSNGFPPIDLVIVVGYIGIQPRIAFHGSISYCDKPFCSVVKNDGNALPIMVKDCFALPNHIPIVAKKTKAPASGANSNTYFASNPNSSITITITNILYHSVNKYQNAMSIPMGITGMELSYKQKLSANNILHSVFRNPLGIDYFGIVQFL